MTTEDRTRAIAWFEKQSKCLAIPGAAKMFGLAAELLNAMDAENEPLTLEQLRETDGKPVWIDGEYPNGWRICYGKRPRKRRGREVINFGNGVLQFEDEYGKTWLAYRRPSRKDDEA